MATLKCGLRRKNSGGTYDTVALQSSSDIVYRPSGRTVEQDLAAYLPTVQSSDTVPNSLTKGNIRSGNSRAWIGLDTVKEILTGSYPIPVSKGGTGVTSLSSLKDSLGISSSSGISNIEYKFVSYTEPYPTYNYYNKTSTVSFSFTIKAAIIIWWIDGNPDHSYSYPQGINVLTSSGDSTPHADSRVSFNLSDKTITITQYIEQSSYRGNFQILVFG